MLVTMCLIDHSPRYQPLVFLEFPALIILMKSPTACPRLARVNPTFPRLGAAGKKVPAGSALQPAAHFPHSITYPLGSTSVAHQNRVRISLAFFFVTFFLFPFLFRLLMLPPKDILEPTSSSSSSLASNSSKKSWSLSSLGAGLLFPKLGTTLTYRPGVSLLIQPSYATL